MTPTRVAALRAMAAADESPHERDIARAKLAEAGVPIDPPRPPAPPAASPAPWPRWSFSSTGTVSSATTFTSLWIRVTTP